METKDWLLIKLVQLPNEVKELYKIKSTYRFDCILIAEQPNSEYKGFEAFKNPKGMLFFYKAESKELIEANSKRLAEFCLGNNNLNFSSLYFLIESPLFAFGYPNPKKFISKDKKPNPLFEFRNDLYLFIINTDFTEIEVLIIPNNRHLANQHYQRLIDNEYSDILESLRKKYKPYFPYLGL